MMQAGKGTDFSRAVGLTAIAVGLVIFALGAAILSVVALAGIALAAGGAVAYTWFSLGRMAVFSGLASAFLAALAAWVLMRWMMRWVALSSGLVPLFTVEGTSAILGTSLLMSILPAMGYVHFRARYGPSLGKSLVYGVILSVGGGVPILLLVLSEVTGVAREPAVPVSFFLGVPVLFSLTLEGTHRFLRGLCHLPAR